MSKIYVASSWRNEYQPLVVEALRNEGHDVYDFKNPPKRSGFQWSDIDLEWQKWTTADYIKALEHPISEAGYMSDFNGMEAADTCVLVLPCNRSAHSEAGYMAGQGKRVIVYLPEQQEPELMYKLYTAVTGDIEEVCYLAGYNI